MSDAPRLRRNLRFVQQSQNGETVHVVKDPVSLKYFRFGEREVGLMQLMDGERSLEQLADAARATLGIATNAAAIERFVTRLKEMGLVERTQEERSALLMEFVRRSRASRRRGEGSTITRMRFSLGDPDELLTRLDRMFALCFTRRFIFASLALFRRVCVGGRHALVAFRRRHKRVVFAAALHPCLHFHALCDRDRGAADSRVRSRRRLQALRRRGA